MKKVPIIMVERDKIPQLMADVGKSESAVYMALRFATRGSDPDLIRKKALDEYGGIRTTKIVQ